MEPLYYWEGRKLLMDTIVHRKRITGYEGDKPVYCSFDLRRFIMPPEDETMGAAWQQLARAHHAYLDGLSRSHRDDARAKVVWDFVIEQIRYESEQGDDDVWHFPPETLRLRRGDCEDKTFLCASLLLAAGISSERVRVVIGLLVPCDESQPAEGHAWPMYRNSRGVWCILEPNLPHLPVRVTRDGYADPVVPPQAPGIHGAMFLSADRLAADGCREQYVPLVCFNQQAVWTVEACRPNSIRGARRFEPDWSRNPTFEQILRRSARNAGEEAMRWK